MKSSGVIALVVFSLLTAAACGRGATGAGDTAAVEKIVAQQEHEWVAAIVAKDAATIGRLLDDEFIGTTNEQRYTKAEAIADMQAATYESLDVSDLQVHVFGDTAIATLGQAEKGRHGNDTFSGRYLFTDVWVKRGGQWRAVASHGSSIK